MLLSPLQSRLAASFLASCLVLVFYFLVCQPQFALAAEVEAPGGDWSVHEEAPYVLRERQQQLSYEPDFSQFDQSIRGRAAVLVTSLNNNVPSNMNIQVNNTALYVFQASSVSSRTASGSAELKRDLDQGLGPDQEDEASVDADSSLSRRQNPKMLYISANTCQQPSRIGNGRANIPQLILYVSTSSLNKSPGPLAPANQQQSIMFNEGAIIYNTTLTGDVYFGVYAPNVATDQFDSVASPYSVQIAASIDEPYHSYPNQQQADLIWVDSDASATLFTTRNVTSSPSEVLSSPPYIMFAQSQDDPTINGMRNSYCGLGKWAQIRQLDDGKGKIRTGLRRDADTNLTKQEFYLDGLNASTKYTGFLAVYQEPGSERDVPGGGGMVLRQTDFETKPAGACTVIFNLTLCDGLQYAAPGNSTLFPDSKSLADFYDNYTQSIYDNFDKALQQIACEAPPEGQWSLVRNCSQCRQAYKDWLCSVAIPRCEDFSSDKPNLQPRNIAAPFANGSFVDQSILNEFGNVLAYNSSRNPVIDQNVQPGPYKELLPCDDVCYNLFQSCPAAMGLSCPTPNNIGYSTSYAARDKNGGLTCNYQGSVNSLPSGAVSLLHIGALSWAPAVVTMGLTIGFWI